MNDTVINLVKQLDSSVSQRFSDEQINIFIDIAKLMTTNVEIQAEQKDLANALLTLDMLSTPERSNFTSKKIGAVSISYSKGSSTSKWRSMYESLLNGFMTDDLSILYRGI